MFPKSLVLLIMLYFKVKSLKLTFLDKNKVYGVGKNTYHQLGQYSLYFTHPYEFSTEKGTHIKKIIASFDYSHFITGNKSMIDYFRRWNIIFQWKK